MTKPGLVQKKTGMYTNTHIETAEPLSVPKSPLSKIPMPCKQHYLSQ